MKKTVSILCAISIVLALLCSLTGCGSGRSDRFAAESVNEPFAESIVLGVRDNFPGLGTNGQTVYDHTLNVCQNYGEISWVVVEGKPYQTRKISVSKANKDISKSKEREIAKRTTDSIMQTMVSLKAQTPEADTLSSIKLSANMLNSSKYSKKIMLVYDNGLCTAGLLSQLNSNILGADPVIVADKLESLHALPELEGIDVYWIGLGCVSGEQQTIPDSYMYALKTLWSEIVERSGGTVSFDPTPVTGEQKAGLPKVTAVDFPQDIVDVSDVDFDNTHVISLREDTVKFLPDRADFADPAVAEAALKPVCKYLRANTDKRILIAGTTAKVGDGDGKELSYRRAQAVKNTLIHNGVSDAQVDCIGLGCSDNQFRVDDHNADGSLNEEMAAKNRAIYIVLADSSSAGQLTAARSA